MSEDITRDELKPCPFCGATNVDVAEGTTFRWRYAYCAECDARAGEVRHNTMADDQASAKLETHAKAIAAWNIRTPAPAETFAALEAECEAMRADAARWQWIREHGHSFDRDGVCFGDDRFALSPDEMDQRADADIAAALLSEKSDGTD